MPNYYSIRDLPRALAHLPPSKACAPVYCVSGMVSKSEFQSFIFWVKTNENEIQRSLSSRIPIYMVGHMLVEVPQ